MEERQLMLNCLDDGWLSTDLRTENRSGDLVVFGCIHLCKAGLSINESKTTTRRHRVR